MAILRPEEQGHISSAVFGVGGLTDAPAGDVRPWSPAAPAAPEPEPAPEPVVEPESAPPEQAAPAEPPPPPVFEIPEELLGALYQEVFQQGLVDGRAQGVAELEPYKAKYLNALTALEGLSEALVERNRVSVITLACKVAEQVLRAHLRLSPADLIAQVQSVIAEMEPVEEVIVSASADDFEYLTAQKEELAQGVGAAFTVQVVQDNTLETGDFQVATQGITADARIRQRIATLEGAMLQAALEEGTS
ncbi:MAG: FliH/SctL family protein [Bradymonadia bacterium]